MKDLYSFHRDEECARQTYEQVCDAYERIFQKLELNCYKGLSDIINYIGNFVSGFFYLVPANSGLMGGSLNHEFLAVTNVGEDTVLICSKYVE
jgi:prolyl-tRNA synthetase